MATTANLVGQDGAVTSAPEGEHEQQQPAGDERRQSQHGCDDHELR